MIKTTDKYALFYTEWPSNFCKTQFTWDAFGERHSFFCTEQAFMWAKAKYFNDDASAQAILAEKNDPWVCKMIGRGVKNYDDAKWNLVRRSFMFDVNLEKYKQDAKLQKKLLDSQFDNLEFVEASPTDRIWGIGRAQSDPKAEDKANWKGQNLLGQVITQVREVLKHDLA